MGSREKAVAVSADPGPAAEITTHAKRKKITRAPHIPEHLPIVRKTLDPPEVLLNPEKFRRIGEEVREQLGFKPAEFFRIQLVRGKFVLIEDPVAKPIISPLPPSLQDRCIATPSLIAGMNYTRRKLRSNKEAMLEINLVLARPGAPSKIQWPLHSRAMKIWWISSSNPTITHDSSDFRFAKTTWIRSAVSMSGVGGGLSGRAELEWLMVGNLKDPDVGTT